MRAYILGVGGVGSWLAPSLCLLIGKENVVLIDGDTLETGNLNRQLFTTDDLGRNKAEALAEKYGCDSIPQFHSAGTVRYIPGDWIFVCVDNNPARREALTCADVSQANVIIAANEKHSSEAYYYWTEWRETNRDPRVYYPEIAEDHTGDPRMARVGCTGVVQEQTPQLVSSNFMAAALAQHLFVLWGMSVGNQVTNTDKEILPRLPYKLNANLSKLECHTLGEIKPVAQTTEERNEV